MGHPYLLAPLQGLLLLQGVRTSSTLVEGFIWGMATADLLNPSNSTQLMDATIVAHAAVGGQEFGGARPACRVPADTNLTISFPNATIFASCTPTTPAPPPPQLTSPQVR